MQTLQALIAFIGVLHAAAAYFYFSKDRGASAWAAAWSVFTAFGVWLLPGHPWQISLLFIATVAIWTAWWASISAMTERHWVPEGMLQATGEFEANRLTMHNVRNFAWRGPRDFDPHWETRRYDLSALAAVDLFVCTWGDPNVAHLIVSFVFDNVPPLAFSIETRRDVDEHWSMLAGFMRAYELIIIAADERDVVRVRTNVRRETVRRYRLVATPQMRRHLLTHYVNACNELAAQARFYNTLWRNCTTEVMSMLRAAGRPIPFDWRMIVSGHVPWYLYRHELLDTRRPFAELVAEADIGERARAADARVDFSARIRRRAVDTEREATAPASPDTAVATAP